MPQLLCNGLALDTACFGEPTAPALVLVRGLGSQRIHWPDEVIDGFVAAGFYVVTFDNRDVGRSQRMQHGYALRDMAEDVCGLLDALSITQAHVLGISMGGVIAQLLALRHPDRVLSATLVFSTSLAPYLTPASEEVRAALLAKPPTQARADVVAHELATGKLWASPAYPFDPEERAGVIGRAYDRGYHPAGAARQYEALMGAADDLTQIERITTPTLVIHGQEDTLLPPDHGRDIAKRIPGAKLIEVPGMGHDLEGAMRARLVRMVADFIAALETDAKG